MPSTENFEAVEFLSEKLNKASAVYFTDYLGLDVTSITELRSQFFDASVEFRVAKNTLLKLAAENNKLEGLDEILNGPTAIALTYDDPTLPAKVIKNFTKEHKLPTVKGILFDGEFFPGTEFTRIADLPSKEDLLAKLLNMVQQPLVQLTNTLRAPLTHLGNALQQLQNQKT